jgi:hypothetical protein
MSSSVLAAKNASHRSDIERLRDRPSEQFGIFHKNHLEQHVIRRFIL